MQFPRLLHPILQTQPPMPSSIQLHIPEPCHEDWNAMSPKEQGRFCGSCCKTVVDFSMMTDKEIVEYISTASHHVCGRFSNDQLNKSLPVTNNKKRYSFTYLWNVLLATLLITKANAQVKPVKPKKPHTVITPLQPTMGIIAYVPDKSAVVPVELYGAVLDAETHEPVDGASIHIKGVEKITAADSSGVFHIPVHKKLPVQLEISAIGYETQIFAVDKNTDWNNLIIYLKREAEDLPTVTVISYPVQGKLSYTHCSMPVRVKDSVIARYIEPVTDKMKTTVNNVVPSLFKKDIKVYPNPVARGNNIKASLALQQPGTYKLELMNADGQVLHIQPVIMQTKEQVINIPTEQSWSAGIYWIRMSAPKIKNVYQAKVLLQ